jgi:hypothetical protein
LKLSPAAQAAFNAVMGAFHKHVSKLKENEYNEVAGRLVKQLQHFHRPVERVLSEQSTIGHCPRCQKSYVLLRQVLSINGLDIESKCLFLCSECSGQ